VSHLKLNLPLLVLPPACLSVCLPVCLSRAPAGMSTDAFADFVVGHGELWSAQLFAATCRLQGADAVFMDTREVLVVTPTSDGSSVDLDEEVSNRKLDEWFKAHGNHKIVVATGFIAKNPA
jgi:aspartokinase/homoserine dehydrogenase 1